MKLRAILTSLPLALSVSFVVPLRAEEGGSGHHMPGSAASFIDAFPGKPGEGDYVWFKLALAF